MQQGNDRGLVFNIQKFSVHDGPGIRSLVFLKGCPLRCRWCANPESNHVYPELMYSSNACIGLDECGYCLSACKAGALAEAEGKIAVDRNLCTDCGDCAEACPAKALEICGAYMTVDEVLSVVEEDSAFYARSGGGITLSGGEPLLQAGFASELLCEARSRGMDTAIETTGFAEWEDVERVLMHADTVYYDIKCMDSKKHEEHTGVANGKVIANLERICADFPDLRIKVRTPVVPGFNAAKQDIAAIADFLKGMSRPIEYELLPYHRFGESKYASLGRTYGLAGMPSLEQDKLRELAECANLS